MLLNRMMWRKLCPLRNCNLISQDPKLLKDLCLRGLHLKLLPKLRLQAFTNLFNKSKKQKPSQKVKLFQKLRKKIKKMEMSQRMIMLERIKRQKFKRLLKRNPKKRNLQLMTKRISLKLLEKCALNSLKEKKSLMISMSSSLSQG